MNLSKSQRETLRMMFGGRCAYCGIELIGKWHADHVEPVFRQPGYIRKGFRDIAPEVIVKARILRPQNDHIGNFFPACVPCNIDKGAETLESWRVWLESGMIETMRRNIANMRHSERFGRVVFVTTPLVFWFEKYSKA